jgi:membrane-bound lytic murein transglycosylase MltF
VRNVRSWLWGVSFALAVIGAACGGDPPVSGVAGAAATPAASAPQGSAPAAARPAQDADAPLPPSDLETQLPPEIRESVLNRFTGDFDQMVKRRVVRVGVTFNRTFYFVDKGVQRGVAYEYGQLMEDKINEKLKSGNIKVHVFFVPMGPEKLLPALADGKVDLVAGHMTVTPERQKLVDFSDPTRTNVNEILVTAPGGPAAGSIDDLAGRIVFVRKSTSYYDSLLAHNDQLKAQGKEPVRIELVPENLDDDDLLEMVNAGLLPAVIVDDYLARFWKKVFPAIVLHENVAVRAGGNLGIAIRKNSPQLKAALNRFMGKYGLGSAFGNQIERKYLVNTTYARNATSEAERRKFLSVVQLFRQYSGKYDLDFLLMAAQGYQESRLDQGAKSAVGAIGIMQIMPATGAELKVGDIKQLEPNIHGGVKYMRSVMDANFKNEPMDRLNKGLFTFASYNAGPGKVRQLRREAEKRGLDPDVWFGNVEQIASERIGRETVTYVSNIYKYYVAYRLVVEENERRAAAKASLAGDAPKPRQ